MTTDCSQEPERLNPKDQKHFRHVLGHFPTGIVAVTAAQPSGEPAGMAIGSFSSVSLDPPLVAFLPAKTSTSLPKILEAGSFCVNVLSEDQLETCRTLSMSGVDKFRSIGWTPAPSKAPILDGTVAWIDCDITDVREAGDHYIVVGAVRDFAVTAGQSPLLFFQGGYGRLSPIRDGAAP